MPSRSASRSAKPTAVVAGTDRNGADFSIMYPCPCRSAVASSRPTLDHGLPGGRMESFAAPEHSTKGWHPMTQAKRRPGRPAGVCFRPEDAEAELPGKPTDPEAESLRASTGTCFRPEDAEDLAHRDQLESLRANNTTCFLPEDAEDLAHRDQFQFLRANTSTCFMPEDEEGLALHLNLSRIDSRELEF